MWRVVLFLFMPMLLFAQSKTVSNFIFGHSLIDHRPPAIETPSNETTVPHWVFLLAEHAGHEYSAGGQYGFLPQHQNLPPISQWGYDIVPGVWESDYESWEEAEINTIMITAGNFIQYQPPSESYYNENGTTPISATEEIIDFVGDKKVYIYENWPDMAGFIAGEGFPPSPNEMEDYYTYTKDEFHNWWLQYHNALLESRPEIQVRMIPVGPILAELMEGSVGNIDILDLYEDNAPHGRPNIYFLAGLATYMAMYEEPAPLDFPVPELVSLEIADNFEEIVETIWHHLLNFNTDEGNSRVFYTIPSSLEKVKDERLTIFPNPTSQVLNIKARKKMIAVELRDIMGKVVMRQQVDGNYIKVHLPKGLRGIYTARIFSEGYFQDLKTIMIYPQF